MQYVFDNYSGEDNDEADLDDVSTDVPSFDNLLATAQQGARGAQIDDTESGNDSRAGTIVEIQELCIDEVIDSSINIDF